jgi:UDP-3-O-[3-hydroxymyristoyl] glucosamine N-acyltransferase
MQFDKPVSLAFIAELIGATVYGNTAASAKGINEIHKVQEGDLVFVDHPKYYDTCLKSAASFIIINKQVAIPEGKAILVTDEPFEAYLKIVDHYRPFTPATKPVSDTAVIGEGTVIMPNAFIGNHVQIGTNCIIHPGVTILDYCVLGNDVVIQSGTVIGSDAFYYNKKTNRDIHYKKMKSCGRVVIEDGVEIGAGCTIDRGVTADTLIGAGTKMDNMVHIGQVGVSKTLTIGKGAVINAQSGVPSDVAGGKTYFGSPIMDAKEKIKELVWVKRIPELWNKVMDKK